ncbi:Uncharacterised protein [Mycobacterium tuberculosis]|nr:Uncharacterised protein [Mycobacterium tuberculosis]
MPGRFRASYAGGIQRTIPSAVFPRTNDEEISVTVLEGVQFGDSLVLVQVDVGRSCG